MLSSKPNANIDKNTNMEWSLYVHFLQVVGDLEWRLGLRLDLINSDTFCDLFQGKPLGRANIEYSEVGDDGRYALLASERECTLLEDLRVALFVGVLHGNDDLGLRGVGDEVHGTADAFDLSWKHEVGKVCAISVRMPMKRMAGDLLTSVCVDLHSS
jgi:hypothetical protein